LIRAMENKTTPATRAIIALGLSVHHDGLTAASYKRFRKEARPY
jgi:hypothetical protein